MIQKTALLFLGLALLFSCNKLTEQQETPIAFVSGKPVAISEFMAYYSRFNEHLESSVSNPRIVEMQKTQALNEAIIFHVLVSQAERDKVPLPYEEIEGKLANWKEGYPHGGFENMLIRNGTNEAYLKKQLTQQILATRYIELIFSHELLVSDEESYSFFKDNNDTFDRPERVHAHQLVVPSEEEALKVRQEIVNEALTFEAAARKFSISPDSPRGGDIGFYSKGDKIPQFDFAFDLSVGGISKPIQSEYGYHLLKLVEKEPARKLTYLEAKPDIVKMLRQAKIEKIYRDWMSKLLRDLEITRNERAFSSIH